ncbi:SDR family oxidoreductase [Olleya sp. UBA1516]|uniref:SDR family oxidoreductase n=1 Tax=Olleya sp. UBA1516 TaxID=1947013 RepID=UPI0025FA5A84|nr:SDR family oxidoreductase [Olleya sp. UBA1516]|tara:strand:+ start:40087 stop:40731 length:645 start_codon:yes stop_codon:yes gene_type:complete
MENILVAGANGTTGKKIVNLLNESQYFNPIAMVRKEEQIPYFKAKNIETVLADLEQDVAGAFNKSIDKVVFAAGSGGKKVVEVDQEGAKRMIDASNKYKVRKFVMLSSMGADQPEKAEQLQDYLKAKHNADEYLKSSGLNYSIVRPGSLTNGELTNKIQLETKLNKSGEISRNDVAQTLVRSLNDDVANNATFEILKGETLIGDALNTVSKVNG